MKKYLLASTLLFGSFASPTFAEEPSGFYLSLGGGINFLGDIDSSVGVIEGTYDTDNPLQYSLAIGKEFDDWRLEFNYAGATISSDSVTVTAGGNGVTAALSPDLEADVSSYMIYAYKDFPGDTKLTPYIGGGLGISTFEFPAQSVTAGGVTLQLQGTDEQLFTFGLKAGIDYEIVENTSLYSELGFVNLASFETDGEEFDSINSFVVSAGLRFTF